MSADLQGKTLHLATDVDDFPLVYERSDGTVSGLNVFAMTELANRYNFTFTTTKNAPDFLWGDYENGSWSGLLGLVYSGKKDLTINYFSMPLDMKRLEHFDASISYMWEGFGFALKRQQPFPAWINLLHPFDDTVWAAVIITSVSVPVLLYVLLRISGRRSLTRRMSVVDAYTNYFMALVNQSTSRSPTSSPVRLSLACWWLSCLVITLCYASNLVAVLTIPVFPRPLSSVHQLAESSFRCDYDSDSKVLAVETEHSTPTPAPEILTSPTPTPRAQNLALLHRPAHKAT